MVIFHSYVSLPEGKPSSYWGSAMETLQTHQTCRPPWPGFTGPGAGLKRDLAGAKMDKSWENPMGNPWDNHFEVMGKWCFFNENMGISWVKTRWFMIAQLTYIPGELLALGGLTLYLKVAISMWSELGFRGDFRGIT
jgi:hypothetical protein